MHMDSPDRAARLDRDGVLERRHGTHVPFGPSTTHAPHRLPTFFPSKMEASKSLPQRNGSALGPLKVHESDLES